MKNSAADILEFKEGDIVLNENTEMISLVDVGELPSAYKGYPKGTTIKYRPITFEEVEALNSSEIDPLRAMAMLLKAIHCNTLKSEDLYFWDVIYIGVKRKLLAFGDIKGTIYGRCPVCGQIVSKSFNYTELEFDELKVPALPMKMEVAGKKLEFGLLTMKDFLQIDREEGALGVYARMIKNMKFEEAYNLVKNCSGIDIKKLKFMDKQLHYRIKPFVVECENIIDKKPCNEKVVLEVRSPFEIVFPKDEIEADNGFEVQYG